MEFPLNFFQQSSMLFSCMLSKGASPVSSLSIQIHDRLKKYTGVSQPPLTLSCCPAGPAHP